MRNFQVFLCVIIILTSCSIRGQKKNDYDIGFKKINKEFCVKNFSTGKLMWFTNIFDLSISPDGKTIAYVKIYPFHKELYLMDLGTMKEIETGVKSRKILNPLWSPDGTHIAFIWEKDDQLQIGVLNRWKKAVRFWGAGMDLNSPTWTSDGRNVITHDLSNLFIFQPGGIMVKRTNLDSLLGRISLSSNSRFWITKDSLLIWNGPDKNFTTDVEEINEAVFSYSFISKEKKKISPEGIITSSPTYDYNNELLFDGYSKKDQISNIYKLNVISGVAVIIIDSAIYPTCKHKFK
jgi:Tol biopolymer transport system component